MASGLVELTPHRHAALINRLNHRSDPHTLPLPASTNGSHPAKGEKRDTEGETGDSEAVLRHILDSRRCSSAEEVGGMVDEYVAGKPLAYITGFHSFGPLALIVRPPVYIPRIETEQWVLLLASHILSSIPSDRPIRILDICSGTGCIPLLLAHQGGGRIRTVGLDVDDRALAVARENSERNHLQHLSSFERFDLFEDDVGVLRRRLGEFDMVVSNPPYVSSKDMKEVKGKWWEGKFALQGKLKGSLEGPQQNLSLHTDGRGGLDYARMTNGNGNGNDEDHDEKVDEDNDDDGLSFYRRIHEIYSLFLSLTRPPSIPKLVLEVGAKQSPPVKLMYADQGRLEIQKETPRRKDLSTPKLERGDMAGTERSIWIYQG